MKKKTSRGCSIKLPEFPARLAESIVWSAGATGAPAMSSSA
jgi:hypothetical protein